MTEAKTHEHKFRLNTDAFVNTKGPHGDFFMYCPKCDEHPTVSDIEDAVNGHAASQARVEALERDAARYRIIRGEEDSPKTPVAYRPEENGIWGGKELDDWCDAALAAAQQGPDEA